MYYIQFVYFKFLYILSTVSNQLAGNQQRGHIPLMNFISGPSDKGSWTVGQRMGYCITGWAFCTAIKPTIKPHGFLRGLNVKLWSDFLYKYSHHPWDGHCPFDVVILFGLEDIVTGRCQREGQGLEKNTSSYKQRVYRGGYIV